MLVKDVMTKNVVTINKDTTIEEIAHILVNENISGVPVVENEKVVGIVTHKDILYKDIEPKYPAMFEMLGAMVTIKGAKHFNEELKKMVGTKAEDIMTNKVLLIEENDSIEKATTIMVEKDVSKLPVVNKNKIVGIISRADVVKYIAKHLKEPTE